MTKSPTYSDSELLNAINKSDNEAFELLYLRYFLPMCRYAHKKLQDEGIVEELVQDVFVDLWNKRNNVDVNLEVAGLLYAMLRNKALHELRAKMIQARHLANLAVLRKDVQAEELTNELYAKEVQKKLQEAIQQLPPQCREAFTLSRYHHLSYKEIAERMSISINTVEKHIGKALRFLRQEFREYDLPVVVMISLIELALGK